MTELDGFMPQEAFELIEEFGKLISIVPVASGAYDRTTGKVAVTTEPFDRKAIVEDPKGTSLKSETTTYDKKLTVAALNIDVVPIAKFKFVVDGLTYTVDRVKAIYSGELVAIFELYGVI